MKRALTLLALAAAATTVAHAQAPASNDFSAANGPALAANNDPAANGPVNVPGWPSQLGDSNGPSNLPAVGRTYAAPITDPRSGPMNLPGWPDATKGTNASGRLIEMPSNGKCQGVRYGDIVHFTLRVDGVVDARRVYTELAMGLGTHPKFVKTDFMLSTTDSFGGGGMGQRDPGDPQLYHFRFIVPDVRSGIYHSAAIGVRAIYSESSVDEGVGVGLNHRAHEQVRNYCLAVFGGEGGEHRPMVTEFLRGDIEHPSTPPERRLVR